ncbi:hypothetical protein DPMN_154216 [Dreissena polymorpha]|uniref:Uncharacterized protein n=1 Tax=Dreissena polymorpha TaxID=45954 RepID=A0A9D4FRC9_DREPO|nr:hypothetical protein DPMN_154216 [Dreissena polymorpha]
MCALWYSLLLSLRPSTVQTIPLKISNQIECLENDNQALRNENKMLRDRVKDLEYQMEASEQYNRRNNVRIFGVSDLSLKRMH